MVGDFNIILDGKAKTDNKRIDRNAVKEFSDWIKDIDMTKIPSRVFQYTWSNKKEKDRRVYAKIDHMFCNGHRKTPLSTGF